VDVLNGAAHKCSSENAVGDLLCLLALCAVELKEGVVDVALEVRTEPGSEVGVLGCEECQNSVPRMVEASLLTSLALTIDGRESHESANEDNNVGEWKGQALPVYVEEADHFADVKGAMRKS
jgi:hypothetical protein